MASPAEAIAKEGIMGMLAAFVISPLRSNSERLNRRVFLHSSP